MSNRMPYTTTSRWNRAAVLSACLLSAVLVAACDSGTTPGQIMQPKTLQLESHKISYYESDGTGDPILLIHGNSSSGRVFQHQLDSEFGRKYHVVAIDLPGHGDSDPARELSAYNLPNYAATVVAAAKALKMENAVFVGWSLGGHIVLQAQILLPDASGFVIFGTPPLALPPAMEEAFLPNPAMGVAFKAGITEEEAIAFATASFAPDASIDLARFVAEIQKTDGNARAGLAASIAPNSQVAESHQDEVDVVTNLSTPLAILHGQKDQLVSEPYISALNIPALWRDAVQIIPDAGHTPQWEQPEKFNELLEAFVDEVNQKQKAAGK